MSKEGKSPGEMVQDAVNTHSSPSDLKITDMRAAVVCSNYDYPIIRIDTNQDVYGVGEVLLVAGIVEIEQRLERDLACEPAELEIDRHFLAGLPFLEHGLGNFGHGRRVAAHAGTDESRLNQFALAAPILAFAADEALAQSGNEGTDAEMLAVVLGVANQHLFDQHRIARQKEALRPNAAARKRAIRVRQLEKEIENVVAESRDVAAEKRAPGARRKSGVERFRGF